MAKKTATVRARMEPELKKETERILDQLGLNTTEAIRIFFKFSHPANTKARFVTDMVIIC